MISDYTLKIKDFYDSVALSRGFWRKKNNYYHKLVEEFYKFQILPQKKVLEIGCGHGDLLATLKTSYGLGIDLSPEMIKIAKLKFPKLNLIQSDVHNLKVQDKFDYVILSDTIGDLEDVQKSFEEIHKVITPESRIIISYFNYFWEPILKFLQKMKLKMPLPEQNWLSSRDIENLLSLTNFEVIKKGRMVLFPIYIPVISALVNQYLARFPLISKLCLVQYFIVRSKQFEPKDYSVSIIVPARNEEGNIEQLILRTPQIGKSTEIIFVEGGSKDNTFNQIRTLIKKYNKRDLKIIKQIGSSGKADAVRKGFAKASGEILMILDADMTVPPEDLLKFYHVIRTNLGELVMGSRLIYPMEKQAMRLLNTIGNKVFGIAFSFLLDQPIKDTLCGTKVLFKKNYLKIVENRKYFGNFDPFGDFDLIFGAAKLNLKILEIPIRYKARVYGETNISRFKHGWLLLKMTLFAAKKIKFI